MDSLSREEVAAGRPINTEWSGAAAGQEWAKNLRLVERTIHKDEFFFVDVDADGAIIAGDVWSFTVPPMGAYDPSPANGAEVTDLEADLSWDVDWNPIMYGVYFGTDADVVANAAGAPPAMDVGFDPGPLEPGTTYYWRVDVFYGTWVTGQVWSFTVPVPEVVE